jgi:thioredoxin-related protein
VGRYGVRGVPTIIVLDSSGSVVYAQAGAVDREAILAAVEQLLAQ